MMAKHNKTSTKRQQKFVLRYQNCFPAHQKISFLLQKIAFVLQKQQLAHFLILYAYFSAFGTLSHTF